MNLDGASFDEKSVAVDSTKSFTSQINNILGKVALFFFPGASWTEGDYTKISQEDLNELKTLGFIPCEDLGNMVSYRYGSC